MRWGGGNLQPSIRDSGGCINRSIDLQPDGLCTVSFAGVLTAPGLDACNAWLMRAVIGERVNAFVVDYRRCAVALAGADLDRALTQQPPGAVVTRPAAMLGSIDLVDLFRSHAMRMALHGYFRRPFVCPDQARAWGQEMARRQV